VQIDPRAWLKLPSPTLALGAVIVALGVAFVFVAVGGTRADELLATPAKAPPALAVDVTEVPRARDLAPIQSQPLLHASRSFYVAPSPDAAPAAPPRPEYRLTGVFIVPGKPAVAVLAHVSGKSRRVRQGDEIDGWRVQSIANRQVAFTWQNERFELGTAAVQPAATMGLKRVPVVRQRVVSADPGTQTLGGGTATAAPPAMGGPLSNEPRLYRPPPP
jgi:hypothetical protein